MVTTHRLTMDFTVEIWPDELDGGFVAQCVELPGCLSQGETDVEAYRNLKDALKAMLPVVVQDHGL